MMVLLERQNAAAPRIPGESSVLFEACGIRHVLATTEERRAWRTAIGESLILRGSRALILVAVVVLVFIHL